jgi:CRISPR-associated protein Cmr1
VVRTQRHVPTGQAAQELLLELLWKMRQGSLGRSAGQGTGRPGRSRWPDADALRRLYNNPSTRHRTPVHNPPINKLPRAAFGAPIIYHFKTEPGDREPPDTTLVPTLGAPLNRLASPLVLRPHALDPNNYEGLALTLEHPAATGWALLERRGLPRAVSVDLSSAEAGRVIPMTVGTAVYTDPLAAYLARVPAL